MSPRVSIIIPAYNPGRFLRETLASVVAQTFTDWELIVVDDGSSEDLGWVAAMHPAIRYIRQENSGVSAARNTGMAAATGELIALLDADDLWTPHKLQRQIDILDSRPEIACCHTGLERIDPDGKKIGEGFGRQIESHIDLIKQFGIFLSSALFRRSCLNVCGDFDTRFGTCADVDFFLRITKRFKTHYIDEVLAYYRIHTSSMSSTALRVHPMFQEMNKVMKKHMGIAQTEGDAATVEAIKAANLRLRLSHGCTQFDRARQRFRSGKIIEGAGCLGRAIWLTPGHVARSALSNLRARIS